MDGNNDGAWVYDSVPDLNKGDISGGNLLVSGGQAFNKQSYAAPIVIWNDNGDNEW